MQQLETIVQALPAGFFDTAGVPGGDIRNLSMSQSSPQHHQSHNLSLNTQNIIGVPPPALSARTLINPARHFPTASLPSSSSPLGAYGLEQPSTHALPLSSSYLYLDDQGSTRWQGEMSGFPLLDLLIEKEMGPPSEHRSESPEASGVRNHSPPSNRHVGTNGEDKASPTASGTGSSVEDQWFPDRERTKSSVNPEAIWKMVTDGIAPDLMDR